MSVDVWSKTIFLISTLDIIIFIAYILLMLGVGYHFYRSNESEEDYFIGGRSMGPWHIGFSVVATDVGGGFSIGLGGLGFTMGIAGSWMLFTGLLGAWLAACLLIPRVYRLSGFSKLSTFPQIFQNLFGKWPAFLAAVISLIGYLGFTSSQLLAGAKLASGTFPGFGLVQALLLMGIIAVVYTVMGGIKAVIYTDTIQWIILLAGLIFIGLPMGFIAVGGMSGIQAALPARMLSLGNISLVQIINWAITIIPIWFIGMTLYQRIYASRDEQSAKKAWYIAGLFEWPVMAFLGVSLGLLARVAAEQGMFEALGYGVGALPDPEIGLPMLLSTILLSGLLGLMMAAYFSAILSTADSCLMAAAGNLTTDILPFLRKGKTGRTLACSQWATLILGILALGIALYLESVLELMLLSYAFMVSGLLIPLVAGLFFKKANATAAIGAMVAGGAVTIVLTLAKVALPYGFDPILFGLISSIGAYTILYKANQLKSNYENS